MIELDLDIKPHVGLGEVLFGMTREAVRIILGKPSSAERYDYTDKDWDEQWEYDELGLTLHFSPDDDFLLGGITIVNEDARLEGCCLIGLEKDEFIATASSVGIEVEFDEDLVITESYSCGELDLMFFTEEGVLTDICVGPQFDEAGENPIWPESVTGDG